MRECYYEALGVERSATEEEVKKAFKKASLRWHPDKAMQRGEDVEKATRRFKELQAAYECLGDARERAWYDAHREDILSGGDGFGDDEESDDGRKRKKGEVNLWPYFSSTAFDGTFDDASDQSFYAVYARAFAKVVDAEARDSSDADEWPSFGKASSEWAEVKAFYDVFVDFQSARSFANYDLWKVTSDVPRHVRRKAEAENKRERRAAKQSYEAMVRQLALYCRKRDPRVAARARQLQAERDAKDRRLLAEKQAKHLANLEARRKWREETLEDDAFDAYEVRSGTTLADLDDDDDDEDESASSSARKKKKRKNKKKRPTYDDDDDDETVPPPDDDEASSRSPHRGTQSGATAAEDDDPGDPALVSEDEELLDPIQEEEPEDVVYACDVCKKTFKSAKQMENHLQSKAHKKKAGGSGKKGS